MINWMHNDLVRKLKKLIEKYEARTEDGEWVDANFSSLLFELKKLAEFK